MDDTWTSKVPTIDSSIGSSKRLKSEVLLPKALSSPAIPEGSAKGSGSFACRLFGSSALRVYPHSYLLLRNNRELAGRRYSRLMGAGLVERKPQQVPLPEDEDAEMPPKPGAKRGVPVGTTSPSKQRAAQASVDVETLRNLLAEQSSVLIEKVMEGQKQQMEQLASELRGEIKSSEVGVRKDVKRRSCGRSNRRLSSSRKGSTSWRKPEQGRWGLRPLSWMSTMLTGTGAR